MEGGEKVANPQPVSVFPEVDPTPGDAGVTHCIMKALILASLSLWFCAGSALKADIPAAFDPRVKGPHKGSAFLVDPTPRKGGVLILTAPFDRNPEKG